MARDSMSLRTKIPSEKGRGEAIQSWNKDQASATINKSFAVKPVGLRPPVSASATICLNCSSVSSILPFSFSGLAMRHLSCRFSGSTTKNGEGLMARRRFAKLCAARLADGARRNYIQPFSL